MLNFTSRTTYYLSSTPTDMRNGREGLAGIIREKMQHDSYRKASDIGVPFNVIDYYDKLYSNKDTDSFDRLDAYEKNKAKSIRSLIIQG